MPAPNTPKTFPAAEKDGRIAAPALSGVPSQAALTEFLLKALREGRQVTLTASGESMRPLIRPGRDRVTIGPLDGEPRIWDVVCYLRGSGRLVLHRIVGREENGDYILLGDGQHRREHHVALSQMAGHLTVLFRDGRAVPLGKGYRLYVRLLPIIRLARRLRNGLKEHLGWIKRG